MLVLTRRIGERIHIGDDVVISVVRVQGGRVRIGIDAPAHTRVIRAELVDRERALDSRHIQPLPAESHAC